MKKSWNGGMRAHKALILGKPSYFTGFQIAYKHTQQTKCKPALLNMHQKSFHTPRSHNRDIMLGHRKSWQNSVGSYERPAFKNGVGLESLRLGACIYAWVCQQYPQWTHRVEGLIDSSFLLALFLSYTQSASLCYIHRSALFWNMKQDKLSEAYALTNRAVW